MLDDLNLHISCMFEGPFSLDVAHGIYIPSFSYNIYRKKEYARVFILEYGTGNINFFSYDYRWRDILFFLQSVHPCITKLCPLCNLKTVKRYFYDF